MLTCGEMYDQFGGKSQQNRVGTGQLMGHAVSSSNMIYTHPNPELAREFVNRIAGYTRSDKPG